MRHPKISVLVPNFNHADFIEDRILSIKNQTFKDFEVVLLDDASTDGSTEIMESHAQNPFVSHFVRNGTNSGNPFIQWKKGLDLCQGKYVWIAESDDVAEPEFLEVLLETLEKDESIVLAFCDSNRKGTDAKPKAVLQRSGLYQGRDFLAKYMSKKNYVPNASAVLFRKKYITKRALDRISRFRYAGDWIFWNSMLAKGDLYYVDSRLNHFRKHQGSVTSKTSQNLRNKEYKACRLDAIVKSDLPMSSRLVSSMKQLTSFLD